MRGLARWALASKHWVNCRVSGLENAGLVYLLSCMNDSHRRVADANRNITVAS
jgi:hypothetical protein